MRVRLALTVTAVLLLGLLPEGAGASVGPAGRVQAQGVARFPARARLRPPAIPLRSMNPAALRAAKRRAALRAGRSAQPSGPFSSQPRIGVFEGLNKPGLTAPESDDATPPDTTGAVGPNHYIETVNSAIAVYSRTTLSRLAGPITNEQFMGTPGGTDFVSDPQMQWDQQSGRWFYLGVAIAGDGLGGAPGPNYVVFGFSKRSDPGNLGSDWCHYSLPSGSSNGQNLLDDYPKLGHDDRRLVFGTNVINESNDFLTARIWSLPKPGPGTIGGCPSPPTATTFGSPGSPLTTSDGNNAATPVPANTANSQASTYVVAADDASDGGPHNQIMAWHVAGAAGSPSLIRDGNINVSTFIVPRTADQPGPPIDTLDGRLTTAVASVERSAPGQEAVWTQHTVDPGDNSVVVRWYELLPSSRTRRQQGRISTSGGDTYNAAISPAATGDVATVNYNVSSPTLAPEIRARVRTPANGLGSLGPETTLGTSDAPAVDDGCDPVFGCRWGDYAGASPDPSSSSLVWGSNQLTGPPQGSAGFQWLTRNFALMPTGRPPTASIAGPASVAKGGTAVLDGSGSTSDGRIVDYGWDLDGDGTFETDTG
ncbi:MAG: hypothetical protein ABR581_02775, partial [Thermoleophilaceae bacterium]